MSAARIVCLYVHSYCRQQWPEDEAEDYCKGTKMASTVMNSDFADVFDHKGYGSHKYIPADKLTPDLGESEGAGVFGYWKMYDNSYILRTCRGPLAYWSGKDEDAAEWAK